MEKENKDTKVILLHGLGAIIPELDIMMALTLKPLEYYLNIQGVLETYCITYPTAKTTLEQMLKVVDKKISEIASKEEDELIVIGQSMGGLIANNLHKYDWKIKKGIYIASPLNGARLLNTIESKLPIWLANLLYKKIYDELKDKEKENEPPHDYTTISLGWDPIKPEFDGCVYKDEAIINTDKNIHIKYTDHRVSFLFDTRLFKIVHQQIENLV